MPRGTSNVGHAVKTSQKSIRWDISGTNADFIHRDKQSLKWRRPDRRYIDVSMDKTHSTSAMHEQRLINSIGVYAPFIKNEFTGLQKRCRNIKVLWKFNWKFLHFFLTSDFKYKLPSVFETSEDSAHCHDVTRHCSFLWSRNNDVIRCVIIQLNIEHSVRRCASGVDGRVNCSRRYSPVRKKNRKCAIVSITRNSCLFSKHAESVAAAVNVICLVNSMIKTSLCEAPSNFCDGQI